METKDLKLFYEVVRYQSTAKTSQHLGITQSTISKRMAHLEKELGVSLFRRSNKGMSLTKEGEIFKKHAEAILIQLVLMENELKFNPNNLENKKNHDSIE